MSIFVNTRTKECGVYDPKDLDDGNWIEAPKGTQAVYWSYQVSFPVFYKMSRNGLLLVLKNRGWGLSKMQPLELQHNTFILHLWGTLQDFEF